MLKHVPEFNLRLATTADDVQAAQQLRYAVFVAELGGDGQQVDHEQGMEVDCFDPFATHLLLEDVAAGAPTRLIGVYRLMTADMAAKAGGFYSEAEFDVSTLTTSGRRVLELGRSCLHFDYRGGAAMLHLWSGLAKFVLDHEIEILFGTASFHGTDIASLAQPLSHLHYTHAASEDLTTTPLGSGAVAMDLVPKDQIDRKAAMLATPALIKAYLRLGGVVGNGAFVDHAFNTTDVCLILETDKVEPQMRAAIQKESSL